MSALSDQLSSQLTNQMGQENIDRFATFMNLSPKAAIIILGIVTLVVLIWSLIWKGLALWKSARKSHKIWFIVLLIVNTIGILEILYIFVFSKMGEKKQVIAKSTNKKKK